MKSKTKIILYIIFVVSAFFLISVVSETFAVFETAANATANLSLGNWVIRLNSIDISSGQTISFSINSFTYSDSSHIANGFIAPGRTGYFDIIIDPTGTDVAVRYDITLDLQGNYGNNITYSVLNNSGSMIQTAANTYSGIIDLEDVENGDTATLRIVVGWANNTTYNANDTNLGLMRNASISIPAEITVVQYLGETITPYQEG